VRLDRRSSLALGLAAVASPALARTSAEAQLADLERRRGGRIGVAVLDTGSGRRIAHRADERFAMCSTFKTLAVAAVLRRVDAGREDLARPVLVDRAAVMGWAPVTEKRIGQKVSLSGLCEAAMEFSDNGAANLILAAIGGPPAVTAYARAIGDPTTRLDRPELALNQNLPGDPRDTTTPQAMLEDLRRLILGDALSGPSRRRLTDWMLACKTGDERLRAGLPKSWRVADKTGSGSRGAANDIAVCWPPGRAPVLICAYTSGGAGDDARRNATLAEIGRLVAQSSSGGG